MPDSNSVGVGAEWIRDQFMRITGLCERIATKQEEQDRRIEKVEEKLDELREKPVKRYDAVVTAILGAIITIIVGALFVIPKIQK